MNKTQRKTVHENFHKGIHTQRKIIKPGNFTYRNILSVINRHVEPKSNVLDVGCGSGTLAFYLASKGHTVDGIDISTRAIHECRQSARNLGLESNTKFTVMDFPTTIPDRKYDVIILIEVIEHLPNDKFVLQQLNKLLKNKGKLILSTPSQNAPLYRWGFAASFDKRVGHLRRYTLDGLVQLLDENGFAVLEKHRTEGVVRNFLFINPFAGKFVRYVKYFIADGVSIVDRVSQKIFGESNYILVAEKK